MDWIHPAIELVATAVGAWLLHRLRKPSDHQRAELLALIAKESAAFLVAMYPSKPWAELLQLLVQRIAAAAGLPTKNAQAIENAAASALRELGKSPDGAKPNGR